MLEQCNDAERAAQERNFCVVPKNEVESWMLEVSKPLDLKFTFLPDGVRLQEDDMDALFSRLLARCWSKIGGSFRVFADRIGNPHSSHNPKMDSASARVIFKVG